MPKIIQIDLDDPTPLIEPSVEELIEEFTHYVRPTDTHRMILAEMEIYYKENEKFMRKANRAAARRARTALLNLFHLVRQRRIEMVDSYRSWSTDANLPKISKPLKRGRKY